MTEDPEYDALCQRNDAMRHIEPPTYAEEMGKLLRLRTALHCDEMTPEHRRMIAREVLRLELELSVRDAA